MIKHLASLFWLLILVPPCEAWQSRVVDITDGHAITIEKLADESRIKVRLHGIDAPERKQPGGEIAKRFLFEVTLYKTVDVEETNTVK